MYITGTIPQFASLFHQNCSGIDDLTAYQSEANAFCAGGNVPDTLANKWNQEFIKQQFFYIDPSGYSTQWVNTGLFTGV